MDHITTSRRQGWYARQAWLPLPLVVATTAGWLTLVTLVGRRLTIGVGS